MVLVGDNMTPNSFNINSPLMNSYDKWGIKIIDHDVFSPSKRNTSRQIPFRHGSHNMWRERYYNDRTLRLECQLTKQLSKASFREVVYVLSQRNALFLWNEPDKYYIGELYDSVDVDVFPREFGRNFTLPFVCEPFAYKSQVSSPLINGETKIEYAGTAETPTTLILKNTTNQTINSIVVTAIYKQ